MKVKELIAGQQVVTLKSEESLRRAAEVMQEKHVSGIPIVDDWGVLAGLVTATDLLHLALPGRDAQVDFPQDPIWSPTQRAVAHDREWMNKPCRDAMVTDLCTVDEDA